MTGYQVIKNGTQRALGRLGNCNSIKIQYKLCIHRYTLQQATVSRHVHASVLPVVGKSLSRQQMYVSMLRSAASAL